MTSTDGAILARRDRYRQAVIAVQEPVFRFARRRANADVADEVMADTLLVLWRRLDDVADGGELPFCIGVARRSLANHLRSGERRKRLFGRISSTMPRDAFETHAADVSDDHPELRQALAQLPSGEREVLTMWAWDRLETREIADVLGITPNAASIRLHRARQRLEEELRRKNLLPTGQSPSGATETQ